MKFLKNLLGVLGIFAGGAGPGGAESPKTEGTWTSFQRTGTEAPTFVTAMDGLAPHLKQTGAPLFVLTIQFQEWNDAGLPTAKEFERLNQLDLDFDRAELGHPLQIIGRVTAPKARRFFILTEGEEQALHVLTAAAGSHGYDVKDWQKGDGLATYLTELQPDVSEAALAADQGVLRSLADNGDRADQIRPVDHYSYFPTETAALSFADWATENGFRRMDVRPGDGLTFLVLLQHEGTMLPEDVLAKTTLLREKTMAFSGEYDGWQTQIIQ